MTAGQLSGLRVVEVCQRIVGPMAGWHLALLGAAVAKVETGDGDAARGWGGGALFSLLNSGKQLVRLAEGDADRMALQRLVAESEITLVDSDGPVAAVRAAAEREGAATRAIVIVETDDVPGGHGSAETTVQAALGVLDYVGTPDQEPQRLGADLASTAAAAHAVQAALAPLVRPGGGPAAVAHVSATRALAAEKTITWAARSDPDAWLGYHVTATGRQPDRGYLVRDGAVTLDFPPDNEAGWRSFCDTLGLGDLEAAAGEDWYSTTGMEDAVDWARPYYEHGLAGLTRAESVDFIREHGGWSVPFLTPAEALSDPQSRLYAAASVKGAAVTVRLPWRIGGRPAGEHAFPTTSEAMAEPTR